MTDDTSAQGRTLAERDRIIVAVNAAFLALPRDASWETCAGVVADAVQSALSAPRADVEALRRMFEEGRIYECSLWRNDPLGMPDDYFRRACALAEQDEDAPFDEDTAIMACGHLGSNWSSEWRACMMCSSYGAAREQRISGVEPEPEWNPPVRVNLRAALGLPAPDPDEWEEVDERTKAGLIVLTAIEESHKPGGEDWPEIAFSAADKITSDPPSAVPVADLLPSEVADLGGNAGIFGHLAAPVTFEDWTKHLDVWERGGAFVIAWIDGDTFLGTFKDRISAERSLESLREQVNREAAALRPQPVVAEGPAEQLVHDAMCLAVKYGLDHWITLGAKKAIAALLRPQEPTPAERWHTVGCDGVLSDMRGEWIFCPLCGGRLAFNPPTEPGPHRTEIMTFCLCPGCERLRALRTASEKGER